VAVPSITAAVDARIISGHKRERAAIARVLPAKSRKLRGVDAAGLEAACYAGFLTAYAQGLHLLGRASRDYDYGINLAEVARIWKGGCIVRSRILDILRRAYRADSKLAHPFLSPVFRKSLAPVVGGLRTAVSAATTASIPVPVLGATLAYLDGFGRARLPANLIQAQRDHFGAHTYERVDKPGIFHTKWD